MFAVGGDGAVHQAWVEGGQPVKRPNSLMLGGGSKTVDQDIGASDQALIQASRVFWRCWRLGGTIRVRSSWMHSLPRSQTR